MNYERVLCERVRKVPPSGIRRFFDIVSEMKDVISLGVGEPDFTTPWRCSDAAIYSLRTGHTHYTSNRGLKELTRLISEYEARFGVRYDPATEVMVTVGASEGIDLALRALIEPGDEVLVPDPSYVSYMPCVAFAGGVCVPVKTTAENGFRLTADMLKARITPKTKAVIFPYPNNPTGGVMEPEDMKELAVALDGTDIVVIADEIYAELTYTGRPHVAFASIPGMRERTITLNGFSKAFAMTGWRMGYACAPKEILDVMMRVHQYTIMCAPTAGQYAAVEALKSGLETDFADVKRMVRQYDRRRRVIVDGLRAAGLETHEPLGAFYAFPCVRSTGMTSQEFCVRLLEEERVACVPGDAFGETGEGYVRCSYASSLENITEAVRRIGAFTARHHG
ncbi:MAG: aminotransferase class I/II-fold pyridoxal phosphate-dependent enzyme [Eubacteriales bacterium]|nr:aminotransferase class I/II-fold pyridoxal phosphate-dependent enzyme [Clostridiales bacterium]MDY2769774.1 aminotransferase class I/II-fold pyridoxal phosphate-dependent enzyme [Eubacteriales bacterium]